MKTINVVAAVIVDNNKIFATQRGYGELKGGWEFPGGKIEPGETPQEALVREIEEELDTEIEVGELIDTVEYDYPNFHLSMQCFWCHVKEGKLVLKEHEAAKWMHAYELESVDWLPADLGLIAKIREQMLCESFLEIRWNANDILEAMHENGLQGTDEELKKFFEYPRSIKRIEEESIQAGWDIIHKIVNSIHDEM